MSFIELRFFKCDGCENQVELPPRGSFTEPKGWGRVKVIERVHGDDKNPDGQSVDLDLCPKCLTGFRTNINASLLEWQTYERD